MGLFGSGNLHFAQNSPVLNFYARDDFAFQVFFVGKRSIYVLESFKVHNLDACGVNCEDLSGSFINYGNFCVGVDGFYELSFLIVKYAYGYYSCFGGAVFSGFGLGYVHYAAGFVVNHHVAANA